jgi:hypothetical protein
MTASAEDVDELSRTLKLVRPSAEAISRAAPVKNVAARMPPVARPAERQGKRTGSGSGIGGFLLFVIVALVLLGIASIFLS